MATLFLEIDDDLKRELNVYCAQQQMTIKDIVTTLIDKLVRKREGKKS